MQRTLSVSSKHCVLGETSARPESCSLRVPFFDRGLPVRSYVEAPTRKERKTRKERLRSGVLSRISREESVVCVDCCSLWMDRKCVRREVRGSQPHERGGGDARGTDPSASETSILQPHPDRAFPLVVM